MKKRFYYLKESDTMTAGIDQYRCYNGPWITIIGLAGETVYSYRRRMGLTEKGFKVRRIIGKNRKEK